MAIGDFAWGADLLEGALDRANEKTDGTSGYHDKAKAYVRQAYWEVLRAAPWPFAKAALPKTLTLLAPVNVTVNSIAGPTVTLSANQATSLAGRKFSLNSSAAWYRITAHTAGTPTLTLDTAYVETPTSGGGVIYQDEYDLDPLATAVFGALRPRGAILWYPIPLLEESEFRAKYPPHIPLGPGPLSAACIIRYGDFNTTDTFKQELSNPLRIQVVPYPQDALVLEYDYADWHKLSLDRTAYNASAPQPYFHDQLKIPRPDRFIVADLAGSYILFDKKDYQASSQLKADANMYLGVMMTRYLPATLRRFHVRPHNSLAQGLTGRC